MTVRTRLAGLAAVALLLPAAPARADDPLRAELAELARSVKGVLEEENQTAVAVGDFSGPPQLDSQFGPGLQAALGEELVKLQVTVSKRAELSVTGNYADAKEEVNGEAQVVVKINARILSRDGDEKVKLSQKITPRKIRDTATIAKLTGATVALPPAGDKAQRNHEVRKALDDPKVHVDGTKVSAKPGADLAVEVLVADPHGKPAARPPAVRDGQAVVDIHRDEVYELRLHSASHCEAAVSVTIDGVDVFTFSKDKDPKTGRPKFTHFVLPPGSATPIPGWHVTNDPHAAENVLSFKVTEFGKGAGSQIGVPRGKVGVITVTYALAYPSEDELKRAEGDGRSAGGNETGFGPGRKVGLKEVKRAIGTVREVVSIRYSH